MAAKVLIVKVKPKHIREAMTRRGSDTCPIALAARELTGKDCGVTDARIRVGDYSSPMFFRTSRSARLFIERFDGKRSVSPQTFRFREMERTAYL